MYRVAFVGCGGIAQAHAGGYADVPECRIVAAADVSPEALNAFSERYGVEHRYQDFEEMLAKERPDIVSICTWPPQHVAPAIAAAKAGVKGILCEKPMALTLPEADAMVAAAEANGAVLIVGHQRRFAPRYARARRLIEEGAIGTLEELQANCPGDLWSDATHSVDLLRFLSGDLPVAWVFGQMDLQVPPPVDQSRSDPRRPAPGFRYGHPVESGSAAVLQFANGLRGLLETGTLSRPLGYQFVRVTGSEGRIEVSGDPRPTVPDSLRVWRRGETDWRNVDLPHLNQFGEEIRALLASIERGVPHILSGTSARATLEVLVAIMESALRHERVALPIDVRDHPLTRYRAAQPKA